MASDLMQGMNYATPLPALDNEAFRRLIPGTLSNYVIENLRYTLPAHLFIDISASVSACDTFQYLCDDTTDTARFNDGAIDGPGKNVTFEPPGLKEFTGFQKGSFQTKLATEQIECMSRSSILSNWYQRSIQRAIADGRNAIMARFYHKLLASVHPSNTGNNAGLVDSGYHLGTPETPVILDPSSDWGIDDFYSALIEVIRQMPASGAPDDSYGTSAENSFVFGPDRMGQTFRQYKRWSTYDQVGDCGSCNHMKGMFNIHPYGIMHSTSRCIPSRVCKVGTQELRSFPVLFGKRYQGAKAGLQVDTRTWQTQDGESEIMRVNFRHHMHVYDCRNFGVAWVAFKNRQPETASCEV